MRIVAGRQQGGVAAAVTFLVVTVVAVPPLGAEGGMLATLAGAAAGSLAAMRLLRGATGRVAAASIAGATAVLAVGLVP